LSFLARVQCVVSHSLGRKRVTVFGGAELGPKNLVRARVPRAVEYPETFAREAIKHHPRDDPVQQRRIVRHQELVRCHVYGHVVIDGVVRRYDHGHFAPHCLRVPDDGVRCPEGELFEHYCYFSGVLSGADYGEADSTADQGKVEKLSSG